MKNNQESSHIPESNDKMGMDFRVCLVAEVISYDEGKNTVNLKPKVQERVMSEQDRGVEYADMMELDDVPLGTICGILFKPKAGDDGVIFFHDVDLQSYAQDRQLAPVESSRFHDYSDGLFYPTELAATNRPDPFIVIDSEIGRVDFYADAGVWMNGKRIDLHRHPETGSITQNNI